MNNTDICNMALAYLAKGRISSIDENNELARQCKLFYDHSRKGLLREYSWGFAKRIIRLAELDASNPPKGDSAWFNISPDDIDSMEIFYLTYRYRFAPEEEEE